MCIQLLLRDRTSQVAQVWARELKYYLMPVGEQGLHHKRLVTSDYQRWFKHPWLLSCRCCALGPGWSRRTSSSAAWHVERLGAWTHRDELLASRWDAGGFWNLARGITDKIDEVWRCNKKQDMLFPKQCCSMLDFKSGLQPTSTMTPKLILLDLQITTWAAEQIPSKDSATARRIDCAESAFEGKAWKRNMSNLSVEKWMKLVFVLLGHSCVSAKTYDLVNLENRKMWHLTWLGVKLTRHYSWEVLLIPKPECGSLARWSPSRRRPWRIEVTTSLGQKTQA